MALEVILPRVDMDMSEGKIAHWYVKNGDAVTKGQVIFEIETDKATMEIDAAEDGIIQGITGEIGVTMPVGQVVGWILQPGDAIPQAAAQGPGSASAGVAVTAEPAALESAAPSATIAAPSSITSAAKLRATPLARSLGREHGIDLAGLKGSGPNGRVQAADVPLPHGSHARSRPSAPVRPLHAHWYSRAKAVPVVLLHGFGTSQGSWRLLAEALAGLPVLALDLPGHGKSAALSTPSLGTMAEAVLAQLESEGVGDVHLVGHSMGGGVATTLADRLGARLKSLTLIAPMGLGPEINGAFTSGILRASREESLRPWLRELFGDASRLSGSFVATAWQELDSAERRTALAALAEALLPDGTQIALLRDALAPLDVPVKVIWGALDRIIPAHQSLGLPGAVGVHTLAGVGHLPQIEATALVARLVRQQAAAGIAA